MKKILLFMLAMLPVLGAGAQEELTTAQAKQLIKTTSKRYITVHDPSVVWEPSSKRYYIFGSHKASAFTTDMQNWSSANPTWSSANNTAFTTPAVKKVKKGGVEVDFPQFNAMEWSARTDAGYNIDGNMWAPDVIWNEKMQKWCMYLSINGDAWHSSIILLTSTRITGPYQYQGPVVICGFQDSGHSYKGTDLELALGSLNSLPSRYNVGNGWGRRWPHTIDPAVFYDEQGKLWMVYGSWSGGIWMLELDEETGLRDYDVSYPSTNGSSDGVTSDPYFGKKIAGGYYVSGEGSYIEYVGGYYYLFVSYGFFDSVGGYVMRVFRSKNPSGPYTDAAGRSAIFTDYKMNYGKNADNRGVKIFGAYAGWGNMADGELSQGHNSVIAAQDGRTYLVYHTRFQHGGEGHQVRVHQLFQTKNGWLVAAPFEYNGDQLTDEDIRTRQLFTPEQVEGTYQLLVHKYDIDYKNREVVTPVEITLTADGKVSGAYSGTWTMDAGTSYFTLKLGSTTYNGVIIEQQMDGETTKTISFSALANSGVNVWGYQIHPKYLLAKQVSSQTISLYNNMSFSADVDLYGEVNVGLDNVLFRWDSSEPAVISPYGKYNPAGLSADLPVVLTARAETPGYFWQQTYNVVAKAEAFPETDWQSGMVGHYGFDADPMTNTFDHSQQAQLLRLGSSKMPVVQDDEPLRTQRVAHIFAADNDKESYVEMANPLFGRTLGEGATLAFWVKRTDDNLWSGLVGFANGGARFFLTGNSYVGYNSGTGNYLDVNYPQSVTPQHIAVGKWQFVVLTVSSSGLSLYVDGKRKSFTKYAGQLDGRTVASASGFDYSLMLNHLAACSTFSLGKGSFWGSPDALFDDVILYDRALSGTEVIGLTSMASRVYDFRVLDPTGIETVSAGDVSAGTVLYDLQGRRVQRPLRGLYVKDGRKVFVK